MPLRLFSAGSNARGQLGQAHLEDSHWFQTCLFEHSLTNLPADSVVSLCCGANHTLILTERADIRELWGCGDGRKGQLGPSVFEDARQISIFRRIGPDILSAAGLSAEDVSIQHIAASWESTFLVLRSRNISASKDTLISFGNNEYGDLGTGLSPSQLMFSVQPRQIDIETPLTRVYLERFVEFNISKIVAGPHHVIVIVEVSLTDGKDVLLIGWGTCRYGQLGDMPEAGPSKLTGNHKALIKQPSFTPQPHVLSMANKFDQGDKVVDIVLGNSHTIILCSSGKVYGLGSNKKRQLENINQIMQIKMIGSTWNGSYLVQEENIISDPNDSYWRIYAMGASDKGQLGRPEGSSSISATVPFSFTPASRRIIALACGSEHVLCLLKRHSSKHSEAVTNGEVWGWGWNEHGNLGLGHTADIHQPSLLWPVETIDLPSSIVIRVWGGCGTSWLLLQHNE